VAIVAVSGAHDQWELRTLEAHNMWAFPVMMANGELVNYRAAAEVIAASQRPGDGIIYQASDQNHYEVDTAIAYYLRGKPLPKPVLQAETPVRANSLQPVECADPAACLTGTPRLWVVYINHLTSTPQNPFAAMPSADASYLAAIGYLTQTLYKEDGITVALLTAG
jgi:mannosyltransferase